MQEIPKKDLGLIVRWLTAKAQVLPEISKQLFALCGCSDAKQLADCDVMKLSSFWRTAVANDTVLEEFSNWVWLEYVAAVRQNKIIDQIRTAQDEVYAKARQEQRAKAELQSLNIPGVGTELKKLLKRIGIVPAVNCKCNARAATMNAKGIPWCEEHFDEIVGWLQEEAANRKLPFLPVLGRQLLKLAISRAKKHQP